MAQILQTVDKQIALDNGNNFQIEIQNTLDDSPTLYRPDIDEHYHSVKGALAECEHVYINSALRYHRSPDVTVLEIGFGTGLNALASALLSDKSLFYHTFELYPLNFSLCKSLAYDTALSNAHNDIPADFVSDVWQKIHEAEWDITTDILPRFTINKHHADVTTDGFNGLQPDSVDIVYYDAFAPEKQPEMWDRHLFETVFRLMRHDGILTTYCAKGYIRRMLKEIGFSVERLAGPPGGKREILRAVKS